MLYKTIVRPLLFRGDPEKTHERTLALLARLTALQGLLERCFSVDDKRLHLKLGSLPLPNPVGLAGGFDKNGIAIRSLAGFGFGFMEIGAVTALAQPGNPKPRLYRLPEDQALINRLGFNNEGAEAVARRRGLLAGGHPLPRYPMPGGWIKLPAAWLVEHSGFPRGYRRANVGLSSKHALSMINLGGAKASEILELMRDIQTAVHNTFGVKLKPEPIFLGFSESEVL